MNISLAEGQNSCEAINRRAEHLSEWVRQECGVSSRLIDEHTTAARRTSGESELTTRLCRDEGVHGHDRGAEKLERLHGQPGEQESSFFFCPCPFISGL